MKIKFPYKTYLLKHIYLYVIAAIVLPLGILYGVNQKLKTKSYEKLNLFISCLVKEGADTNELANTLFANLSENIIEAQIYTYDETANAGQESLYAYYESISDILIYSEEYITDYVGGFTTLPEEFVNSNCYKENYGYRVYDKETKSGYLTSYFDYDTDQNYYMFINKNSEHIKPLNDKSISDDALTLFKNFIQ